MIEFGKTLRTAREAKGYTAAQLAEMTHLAPSVVTKLEQENFCTLPAPIYGRGFVKLYCEAVGLEPKPLVDAFMAAFSKPKAVPVASPELPPTEPPRERDDDVPEAKPEPQPSQQDFFAEPTPTVREAPRTISETPPTVREAPLPNREPPSLSRYATPFRDIGQGISSVWRIGLLAAGGAIVLALLIWGLCALRRTTTPRVLPEPPTAAAVPQDTPRQTPSAAPDAHAKKERTPQDIPALYLY